LFLLGENQFLHGLGLSDFSEGLTHSWGSLNKVILPVIGVLDGVDDEVGQESSNWIGFHQMVSGVFWVIDAFNTESQELVSDLDLWAHSRHGSSDDWVGQDDLEWASDDTDTVEDSEEVLNLDLAGVEGLAGEESDSLDVIGEVLGGLFGEFTEGDESFLGFIDSLQDLVLGPLNTDLKAVVDGLIDDSLLGLVQSNIDSVLGLVNSDVDSFVGLLDGSVNTVGGGSNSGVDGTGCFVDGGIDSGFDVADSAGNSLLDAAEDTSE